MSNPGFYFLRWHARSITRTRLSVSKLCVSSEQPEGPPKHYTQTTGQSKTLSGRLTVGISRNGPRGSKTGIQCVGGTVPPWPRALSPPPIPGGDSERGSGMNSLWITPSTGKTFLFTFLWPYCGFGRGMFRESRFFLTRIHRKIILR